MSLKATCICEAWINDNATETGDRFDFDISRIVRDMSEAERAKLVAEVDKLHGQDLDYIAERAGVTARHDGPFTVRIDDEALADFIAKGMPVSHRKIALVAIAFDDPENDIDETADLATWVEAAMGKSARNVSATAYSNLKALQEDVADGFDPFADDVAAGAQEVKPTTVTLDIETNDGVTSFGR